MIKKLLFVGILFSGFNARSQSFSALYPFSAVTPTTGTIDPTAPPTVPNSVLSAFTAFGTGTVSSATGAFSFGGWGVGATNGDDLNFTGTLDQSKYYQFGFNFIGTNALLTLNSLTFYVLRSQTGPRNWAIRSNQDGYTSNLTSSVNSNTNISVQTGNKFFWSLDSYTTSLQQKGNTVILGAPTFSNMNTFPPIFRIYAWNSEDLAGTFAIDTVILNGQVTSNVGLAKLTQNLNSSFRIYPNPSNDGIVFIEPARSNYQKMEIVNSIGSVLFEDYVNVDNKIELNLNFLSDGVYFVRLVYDNAVFTERFFISK